jgi:hypothetical protein
LAFFRLQQINLNKVERGSDGKGHERNTLLFDLTTPSGAILAAVRYSTGTLLVEYGTTNLKIEVHETANVGDP